MSWDTSDRRSRLPSDWEQRVAAVRLRCGDRCEFRFPNGGRCRLKMDDCDHVQRGDDHSLENLQGLCSGHHKRKTQYEAQKARTDIRDRGRRPPERHPGAL